MQSQEPLHLTSDPGSRPGTRILRVTGPILLQHVFAFQDALRKDAATTSVTILDLSGVPYLDSAGMGAIINFYVSCQKTGHKLIVTGVSERVSALFALTHVDTLITVLPDVAAAEAAE
jgi:anti-sigma B factor antagonist